jgi:hypothetical protein
LGFSAPSQVHISGLCTISDRATFSPSFRYLPRHAAGADITVAARATNKTIFFIMAAKVQKKIDTRKKMSIFFVQTGSFRA